MKTKKIVQIGERRSRDPQKKAVSESLFSQVRGKKGNFQCMISLAGLANFSLDNTFLNMFEKSNRNYDAKSFLVGNLFSHIRFWRELYRTPSERLRDKIERENSKIVACGV